MTNEIAGKAGPGRMQIKRGFADTALGQFHYQQAGTGKPIVLLPGASQSHHHLALLQHHLAASHKVTVFDLLGSGYSAPMPENPEIPSLAAAVAEAIGAVCDGSVLLYGIHTGNKIAASLTAQQPRLVRALALCGQTHSLIVDQALREVQMRNVSQHRFPSENVATSFSALRDWVLSWRELEGMWFAASALDSQTAPLARASIRQNVADLLLATDSLAPLYQANFRYNLEADLRCITVPTLVVEIATPLEDRAIGRQAASVTECIAGATATVFEEADGLGLTLENRAPELARILATFESGCGP